MDAEIENVKAIPMPPPRKRTQAIDSSLCNASVKAVRDCLADQSRSSVKTWVYIGKELVGIQERAGKSFRSMFAKNTKEQKDETKYPFSRTTGIMFIEIAKVFGVVDGVNHSLPTAYPTLYELSKLGQERISAYLVTGAIHPLMTRAEAHKLVTPAKPKKKRLEPPIVSTVEAWSTTVKRDAPKQERVEVVWELIARLGLKPNDLFEGVK